MPSYPQSRVTASGSTITAFPNRAKSITPDDNAEYTYGLQLYANSAGDITVEPYYGGNTVTFSLTAGQFVPVVCRRVLATGTTATDLVGIY